MDADHVCMMPRCSESDFLPTKCYDCNKSYCSSHISPAAHKCEKYSRSDARAVVCPLCSAPIAVRPGESPDLAVSRHIDQGCAPQAAQSAAETRLNFCSFGNCTRNEIQRIVCDGCRQTYCVEHRHAAQHNCIAKRESPPPAPSKTSTTPPRTSPRAAASKYVPLVNLVARNTPDKAFQLPPSNLQGVASNHLLVRVFAYVDVRVNQPPQCLAPAYFSVPLSAPIGRVLDAITSRMDIPNDNHLARSDDQRLWLLTLPRLGQGRSSDAFCLPPNLKVEDCLGGVTPTLGSTRPEHMVTVLLCRGQSLPEPIALDVDALAQQQQQQQQQQPRAQGSSLSQPPRPAAAAPPQKDATCVTC